MIATLLVDDTPSIAPLTLAHELGWATLPCAVETVAGLTAQVARAHPEALVFVPFTEYPELQEGYTILPVLAAGGNYNAAIVLVADRPLEEIDECVIDLGEVSRVAEALAYATLKKFYGLTPVAWVRTRPETAEHPVVQICEGGEALHLLDEPGNRVVVNLGRAWFILTGLPPLTHLLLAPDKLLREAPGDVQAFTAALAAAQAARAARKAELRGELSARYGVSVAQLDRYYDDQFTTLTGDAQKSIRALLTATARNLGLPAVGALKLPPGVLNV